MDKALAERLFGTDAAIGVTFEIEGEPDPISACEFDRRYGALPHREMPDAVSVLPSGGSAVCCTEYAHHIKRVLEPLGHTVAVVGFANEDNPKSRCAIVEYHPCGHDFAIVDERFLIDPWVRLVAAVEDQIFYDLHNPVDMQKALVVYGPRECWKSLLQ